MDALQNESCKRYAAHGKTSLMAAVAIDPNRNRNPTVDANAARENQEPPQILQQDVDSVNDGDGDEISEEAHLRIMRYAIRELLQQEGFE